MTAPALASGTGTAGLLARLGIALPILQAPMAGVSSPAMAAAVAAAGGLGAIAIGATDTAGAQAMLGEVRARTAAPINVNLFAHRPPPDDPARAAAWIARLRPEFARFGAAPPAGLHAPYASARGNDALVAMLRAARPAVVSLHFGLLEPLALQALREAGILLIATATSVAEARQAAAAGIDAIVAQGWEAGGHRGLFDPDAPDDRLGTLALVRILARTIDRPVIAAGGIMDGAGIDAARALGAAAAQLGTAYVATDESLADPAYRAALFGAPAGHTVMTRAISGRPARCLANRFTALGRAIPAAAIPAYPIAYDLGKALHAAARATGEAGYGAHWAGQGAPLARALPAAALTRALAGEMRG